MKITVVTVCLNSEKTIERTIKSVLNQSYKDIEYIIWDGDSKDQTKNIVKKYLSDPRLVFISKKDKGPGDALNKSFKIANGKFLNFLGADDFFYDNTVIENVCDFLKKNKELDALYGNLSYFGNKFIKRKWIVGHLSRNDLLLGLAVPFPTLFFKKELVSLYNGLDTSIDICDDFDLIFRYYYVHRRRFSYLDKMFVNMNSNGRSSTLKARLKSFFELLQIFKKYEININPYAFFLRRYVYKIKQFF